MDFEDYKIIEGTITVDDELSTSFGCIGTLDGSSDISAVEKRCEGSVIKTVKKVNKVAVTLTGHPYVSVLRKVAGMTNKGLKEGVYGYGADIKSKKIVFTAKVEDMEGNIKYIAFPNMDDVKGLNIKINNDVTEIEMKNFEFSALKDENNMFYYEALERDLEDEDLKMKWLTNFTPSLVRISDEVIDNENSENNENNENNENSENNGNNENNEP